MTKLLDANWLRGVHCSTISDFPKTNKMAERYLTTNEICLLFWPFCFPADRGLYLCRKAKKKRPLPRSDTSSVHDRGRVKPVCKTSSETGLGKQILRMLCAELRCNDIEPVVSKWWLAQRRHFEVFHVVWKCSKLCNWYFQRWNCESSDQPRSQGFRIEDEGRDEKALVWAGQFCIPIG
jgi:hypothetical protein